MANAPFDHARLCALAVTWLKRPSSRGGPGCLVAISESANWINGERPDALGWRPYRHGGSGSVLVEAKVSRTDFLADAAKPHRRDGTSGMGTYRYFLAPEGIVSVGELPPKWGLIEVNGRGHLKVRAGHVLLKHGDEDLWRHECHHGAEIGTLAQCLNRVGDPQQLQDRMRELANRNAHLGKRNDELNARINTLSREVFNLRSAAHTLEPSNPPDALDRILDILNALPPPDRRTTYARLLDAATVHAPDGSSRLEALSPLVFGPTA